MKARAIRADTLSIKNCVPVLSEKDGYWTFPARIISINVHRVNLASYLSSSSHHTSLHNYAHHVSIAWQTCLAPVFPLQVKNQVPTLNSGWNVGECLAHRCLSMPDLCQNGGTCLIIGTGYTCNCPTAFQGRNCEQARTPCHSAPCFRGGTCVANNSSFICQCQLGHGGIRCELSKFGWEILTFIQSEM